jgi:hypothetical protein
MCIYYTSPYPYRWTRPSQAIFQTLLLWLCSDFSAVRNRSANLCFKTFDYMYVLFLSLHESTLVMKWILAQVYHLCFP